MSWRLSATLSTLPLWERPRRTARTSTPHAFSIRRSPEADSLASFGWASRLVTFADQIRCDEDAKRNLMRRQATHAVGANAFDGLAALEAVRRQRHSSRDDLTHQWMRLAGGDGGLHKVQFQYHLLDLNGSDFLAADVDRVREPAAETYPFAICVDQVPRAIPSALVDGRRSIQVAQDRPLAAQPENIIDHSAAHAFALDPQPQTVIAAGGAPQSA